VGCNAGRRRRRLSIFVRGVLNFRGFVSVIEGRRGVKACVLSDSQRRASNKIRLIRYENVVLARSLSCNFYCHVYD
jgi:hypothetical protein